MTRDHRPQKDSLRVQGSVRGECERRQGPRTHASNIVPATHAESWDLARVGDPAALCRCERVVPPLGYESPARSRARPRPPPPHTYCTHDAYRTGRTGPTMQTSGAPIIGHLFLSRPTTVKYNHSSC